jgi:acetyltransferase
MPDSLDCIFRPKSIAVIGASQKPGKIGHEIVHNLVTAEFNGKVFPINPKADVIHSIKAYPTVEDVPDEVEMAIITVPKKIAPEVISQCVRKKVKGLVVITAGFKETGEEGAKVEAEITRVVRSSGMRMVGPNCMGVVNTDPDVRMNASFTRTYPLAGKTAFISQSGALGEAILDYSIETNLGLSKFISLGNRADVTSNDTMEYLKKDASVELVLLYLESFGNPVNFSRIARELSRVKPIIAVKSGRTVAGARAASSHTGSLAGMDIAVDALFGQCGVLRANTIEEVFDMAKAFVGQPRPAGPRVAILTNGGGPGILATDALSTRGLQMASFSPKTLKALSGFLSEDAAVSNPVDMTGSGSPDDFGRALDVMLKDPGVDSALVIVVMPAFLDAKAVARSVIETRKKYPDKLVLACFMTGAEDETGALALLREADIPAYTYPESAAIALEGLERYRNWRERPHGTIKSFTVKKDLVTSVLENARKAGRKLLTVAESQEVLRAYGIDVAASAIVEDEEAAVAFAKTHGYPLVLKILSGKISHKTDRGGVALDIRDEQKLRAEYRRIRGAFGKDEVEAVLVQEMIEGEVETIVGMTYDPTFGPLVMFGLGGIYVEVLRDVSFKMHPLTDLDADDMIRSIKGYKLLTGYRGKEPADVEKIKDTLLRVSQLAGDFPQVRSLEMNPFLVAGVGGCTCAVDARIILT